MATQAEIPESIPITKREGENNLTSEPLDISIKKCSPEKEKVPLHIDIEIENVNVFTQGNVGTIEGESFLRSPSIAKVAYEETNTIAEDYQAAEIPNQAETELAKNKILKEEKIGDEHVQIVADQEAPLEEKKPQIAEEFMDSEIDEKRVIMTHEKPESEPDKQTVKISEETVESSETMKDLSSTEHEIQEKNKSETSFVEQIEDKPETLNEVNETGLEVTVKANKNEVEDQIDILEGIVTADSSLSKTAKDNENEANIGGSFMKHEDNLHREGEELALTETSTTEYRNEAFMTVDGEENIEAKEDGRSETSKHKEQPVQSFLPKHEPGKENPNSSLGLASEEIETTASIEDLKAILQVEKQRLYGNLEENLKETVKDETLSANDIKMTDIPEEKSFSAVEFNENTRDADVEIQNENVEEFHTSHPLVVETVQVVGEKEEEISTAELEEVHEKNEISTYDEKHVSQAYEASESSESTILEHTFTERSLKLKDEAEKICELNFEEKLQVKDDAPKVKKEERHHKEEASDLESQRTTTKGDDNERSTIKEDVPVKSICTGDEADRANYQEDENRQNSEAAASELNGEDQSCITDNETENISNRTTREEAYEGPKIADTAVDTEEEIIKDHTFVDNSSESTGEETTKFSQEDQIEAEKPVAEASKKMEEELGTTSEGEVTEKPVIWKKNIIEDHSITSIEEEIAAEIPKQQVKDRDLEPTSIFEAIDPNEDIETVRSSVAEDHNRGSVESYMTKASEEETSKTNEKPMADVSKCQVSEENTSKENIEESDNCAHKTDSVPTAEDTSLGAVQNEKSILDLDTSVFTTSPETIKNLDAGPQAEEVDSVKVEEVSGMVSQLPEIVHENADDDNTCTKKSDSYEEKVQEIKTSDTVFESKDQGIEELHETVSSLTVEQVETTETEEQIKEVSKIIAESRFQNVEAVPVGVITPDQTLPAEKSEEQLHVPSSASFSREEDRESMNTGKMIEDEGTKNHETELVSMKLEQTSGMVSQFSPTECQNAESMNTEETESSEAVLESKVQIGEKIQETGAITTVQKTAVDKMDEEIKEVPATISELEYYCAETASDGVIIPDRTLPAGKSEEQLQVPSTALLPKEEDLETITTIEKIEDDAQVNNMKLQETSATVTRLSTMEPENAADMRAVEKEGGDVEETKTPETIIVSKSLDVDEEIHETKASLTVDKNDAVKKEEEIKEVHGIVAEPKYHGVETVTDGEINRKSEEQLQVPYTALLSKEADHATTTTMEKTEYESTTKDETEVDFMNFQETSTMVSQLSTIEPDDTSVNVERDADKIEVEETKTSDEVLASKDRDIQEIHETDVERTDAGKMEEEIQVPEKILEPEYAVVDTVTDREITPDQTLPAGKSEEQLQVPSTASLSKEEGHETTSTIDNIQDDSTKENESEVHSIKLQETSAIVSQLSTIEPQNAADMGVTVEEEGGEEEIKTPERVCVSKSLDVEEEIHETTASLTVDKNDSEKMEEEIKEIPGTVAEPEYHGVETVTDGEINPKSEEQLQVPNTALLSKEEDHATTTTIEKTEDDTTTKDVTEVDIMKLQETSTMVSQLSKIEEENADATSVTVEREADKIEVEEIKTSDELLASKDRDIQEIHETDVEKTDAIKMEEVKEVPEKISEPEYPVVDSVTEGEITPDQTLPVGQSEEQLQVPSTASLSKEEDHETTTTVENIEDESTKENESEVHSMKLQETSAMVSQLSTIENAEDMSATVEKEVDKVEVEETKISHEVLLSKDRDVEEVHETGISSTVEKTDANKMEEFKEVPETISEPEYHGVETVAGGETTPDQTLPVPACKSEEQLQVAASTALLSKEEDRETTTTIEKIEEESTKENKTEVDSMKLQETSALVSQLSTTEPENANNWSVAVEKDADEVEETKISDEVVVSKDKDVEEILESRRSLIVEKADASKMEEEIKIVPETFSKHEYHGVETVIEGEIAPDHTLQAGKSEEQLQTPPSTFLSKEEDHEIATTLVQIEDESTNKDEIEVESLNPKQNSSIVLKLSTMGPENSDDMNATVEKEADEVVVEETKTSEAVFVSKDRDVEETQETTTSLTGEETDANKTEEEIKAVSETISEPEYHGVEPVTDGEITPDQTLQAVTSEEKLQVPSSAFLSKKEVHEMTTSVENIEEETTKKEETQVESMKLVEDSTMVSQLPTPEAENADVSVTTEKGADEVEEIKTSDTAVVSKDRGIKEIFEIGTSPTMEKTDIDKVEKEVKEVPEIIYEGVDTLTDVEDNPDQTLPAVELEEQLQEPSCVLLITEQDHGTTTTVEKIEDENTKEDETEFDIMKHEKISGVASQLSKFESENVSNVSVPVENLNADDVEVEGTITSYTASESKDQVVEGIRETEETKAVPETTSEPKYKGVEAVSDGQTVPGQTLPAKTSEDQLEEPSSTLLLKENYKESTTRSEKTEDERINKDGTQMNENLDDQLAACTPEERCVQKEESRELEVSELKLKILEDIQDIPTEAPKEFLGGVSSREHQDHDSEIKYVDSRSEYEKGTDKDFLTGQEGEKCEETTMVLESASDLHGPEVFIRQEETKSEEVKLEAATTELRAEENQSEETSEANDTAENEISSEKTKEEKGVPKDSHLVSPNEETVAKSDQEDKLRDKDETIDITKNGIPNEELAEELEKAGTIKNATEMITVEERAAKDNDQVSTGNLTADECLLLEAEDGKTVEKAVEVDPESQGNETNYREILEEAVALREEGNGSLSVMEKHDEDRTCANDKETEEVKRTKLDVLPVTSAEAEESPDRKIGEKIEDISELVIEEQIHEINKTHEENKDNTTTETNISESLEDNEKHTHTPLGLASKGCEVTEGMNLKEQEVYANEPSTSLHTETAKKETADKESVETVDGKQKDFASEKQTTDEITTTLEQIEDESTKKAEIEVDSMNLKQNSSIASKLSTIGPENSIKADEDEVEETKTSEAVFVSKDKDVEEIHETMTRLTGEKTDAKKTEEEIKAASKIISEPEYHGVETITDGEITPDQILPAVTSEEKLQVPSSALLSKKEVHEKTTSIETIEETQVVRMKLGEDSTMVSQLPTTEAENADVSVTKEKEADEVEEIKASDTAVVSKDQGFKEIFEIGTSPTMEKTDIDKVEKEIKEVPETIYEGVDTLTDVEDNPDQTLPAVKLEEQLQEPSCVLLITEQDHETTTTVEKIEDENTKEDETEFDIMKHEKISGVASQLSKFESENVSNVSVPVENLNADDVEVEGTITSCTASESKDQVVEGIRETEETKAVPETTSEPKYQGVEAVSDGQTAPDQTLPAQTSEDQVEEPSSTLLLKENYKESTTITEKIEDESTKKDETQVNENLDDQLATCTPEERCVQKEEEPRERELEASELKIKILEDIQDIPTEAPKEESTVLGGVSARELQDYASEIDSTSEYEERTSKDILSGQEGEKCEEPSNVEFENTTMVLESASDLHGPNVFIIQEETKSEEVKFEAATTELRAEKTPSEETSKANETPENEISSEKIKEEKGVPEDSHVVSPNEETAAKSDQEDELRDKEETIAITKNGIPNEELSEELEKAGTIKNATEIITDEERAANDNDQVSTGNLTADKCLLLDAEDGKTVAKATEDDLESQGNETNYRETLEEAVALHEEVNVSELVMVKHDEDKTCANDKETEEISSVASQLSSFESENVSNVIVPVENLNADDVEVEGTITSYTASESKDQVVEGIRETEETTAVPETTSQPKYQGVEAVSDGQTAPDQTLPAKTSEDQVEEPSSTLLLKENYKESTTITEKIEDESTKKDETQLNENLDDQLATCTPEEGCVQKEEEPGERELEASELKIKILEDIQDIPTVAPKEESTILGGVSARDHQDYASEIKYVDSTSEYEERTSKEILTGQEGEKCEETSNVEFESTTMVLESASDLHDPEVFIIQEETKSEEVKLEAATTELRAEETQSEETREANETPEKEISSEKMKEEKCVPKDSHVVSPNKETVAKSDQEDELRDNEETIDITKNGIPNEELSQEHEKAGTIKNATVIITDEERAANDNDQVSTGNLMADKCLLLEAEDGKTVEKAIEAVALHEEVNVSESVMVKHDEDKTCANDKETQEISSVESQLSNFESENVSNVSVTVENLNADDVEVEGTKTSDTANESKDQVDEGIRETEETKAVPETISEPKYQGVEAVSDGQTAPDQTLPAKTSEDQVEEPSSTLLLKENYKESTTITEKIEDESTKKDETQLNENLDDQLATCTPEERCVHKEEEPRERELDASELKIKILEDKQDIPTEAPKEETTILGGVSAREHQDYASEIKYVDSTSEYEERTSKDIFTGQEGEKCEETSNVEFENTTMVLESASDLHDPEVFIIQEETKSEEVKLEAATTELRAEETQSEETREANETPENEISSEKIEEEKGVPKDSHIASPNEETVAKSDQEDEYRHKDETIDITKNGIQNEELSEELEKAGILKNDTEILTVEERAANDNDQVSMGNLTADDCLLLEAQDEKTVDKATEADLESQGNETDYRETVEEVVPLRAEVNSSELVMVKHDEDRMCAHNDKETEEVKRTNLDVLPVTDAEAEDSPDRKIGVKIEEISELVSKQPIHEINKPREENKDITTTETNISESFEENEKPTHTPLGLASKGCEVTQGLEVYANEPSTLLHTEIAQKETADKERVETADKKQNDFAFEKQTTDEVTIPVGEKSIKCEEELPKDEEPIEHSIMGKERNLNESEIHSLIAAKEETETQVEDEELNVLAYGKDTSLAISQKDSILNVEKVSEITKDAQEVETISLAKSVEQFPREADPSASIEPEEKRGECGVKARMDDECEATTGKPTTRELAKVPSSNLLKEFPKETPQVAEHLTEERELVVNKEEQQTETAERAQVEEAKTDEEGEDEHKTGDSGSDAPVMVEASRDMDVKPAHKKSHNILSGVGSKVKHSLAKVKKAITGKSAHPKPTSPK